MAHASDLDLLLLQDAKEWNQWRKMMVGKPNLKEANLSGAFLRERDLSGADFTGANLSGAHLSKALLLDANLRDANLSGADLRGANLARACLSRAALIKADLSDANLGQARLHEAYLSEADLSFAELGGANLNHADLSGAQLYKTNLCSADLRSADLRGAHLKKAFLCKANLSNANLNGAHLYKVALDEAILKRANFNAAYLVEADLTAAQVIECNFEGSDLSGSRVYGVSVWDASLAGASQRDLIITPHNEPRITVDNIEVAQFIYLLLNNAKIRGAIDTITSKAVLILGRFTPQRKQTLDALRNALRAKNYLPILFDFEKPDNRDFTETVSTLAHLARFVIADLTDPRSIPQELTAIVPRLLSVPIRPLLFGAQSEWAMFSDLARYPQVIEPFHYTDDAMLVNCIETDIIEPAERKAEEVTNR